MFDGREEEEAKKIAKDPDQAGKYLRWAMSKGSLDAEIEWVVRNLKHDLTDDPKTVYDKLTELAEEKTNPKAQWVLANCYLGITPFELIPIDDTKGTALLTQAGAQGFLSATLDLGVYYLRQEDEATQQQGVHLIETAPTLAVY